MYGLKNSNINTIGKKVFQIEIFCPIHNININFLGFFHTLEQNGRILSFQQQNLLIVFTIVV